MTRELQGSHWNAHSCNGAEVSELPDSVVDDELLDDGALLSEDEVREALTAADPRRPPVEDWMTFLHPTQAALACMHPHGGCCSRRS